MKKASISEAKNNLSALINGLKSGSPVLILDRGRPVARLEPVVADNEGEDNGRLSRLVRSRIVRPRRAPSPEAVFNSQLPAASVGASIVDALIMERREGR